MSLSASITSLSFSVITCHCFLLLVIFFLLLVIVFHYLSLFPLLVIVSITCHCFPLLAIIDLCVIDFYYLYCFPLLFIVFITFYCLPLFVIVRHYLSLPAITCHCLPLLVITRHYWLLPLFVIVFHYLSFSSITCHFLPLLVIVCHYLSFSAITCHCFPLLVIIFIIWHRFPLFVIVFHYLSLVFIPCPCLSLSANVKLIFSGSIIVIAALSRAGKKDGGKSNEHSSSELTVIWTKGQLDYIERLGKHGKVVKMGVDSMIRRSDNSQFRWTVFIWYSTRKTFKIGSLQLAWILSMDNINVNVIWIYYVTDLTDALNILKES